MDEPQLLSGATTAFRYNTVYGVPENTSRGGENAGADEISNV